MFFLTKNIFEARTNKVQITIYKKRNFSKLHILPHEPHLFYLFERFSFGFR